LLTNILVKNVFGREMGGKKGKSEESLAGIEF
jgi:hypothetical protein